MRKCYLRIKKTRYRTFTADLISWDEYRNLPSKEDVCSHVKLVEGVNDGYPMECVMGDAYKTLAEEFNSDKIPNKYFISRYMRPVTKDYTGYDRWRDNYAGFIRRLFYALDYVINIYPKSSESELSAEQFFKAIQDSTTFISDLSPDNVRMPMAMAFAFLNALIRHTRGYEDNLSGVKSYVNWFLDHQDDDDYVTKRMSDIINACGLRAIYEETLLMEFGDRDAELQCPRYHNVGQRGIYTIARYDWPIGLAYVLIDNSKYIDNVIEESQFYDYNYIILSDANPGSDVYNDALKELYTAILECDKVPDEDKVAACCIAAVSYVENNLDLRTKIRPYVRRKFAKIVSCCDELWYIERGLPSVSIACVLWIIMVRKFKYMTNHPMLNCYLETDNIYWDELLCGQMSELLNKIEYEFEMKLALARRWDVIEKLEREYVHSNKV